MALPVLGRHDRPSAWKLSPEEVLWTAMPLFHLSAAPSVLAPMLVGGTTVLAKAFHPGAVCDDIRAHGAIGFASAGAMVSMLQNLPPDPRDAQLPLRFISAAPIDATPTATSKALRLPHRHDVRDDRGLSDRRQGRGRRGGSGRRGGRIRISTCASSTRTAIRCRRHGRRRSRADPGMPHVMSKGCIDQGFQSIPADDPHRRYRPTRCRSEPEHMYDHVEDFVAQTRVESFPRSIEEFIVIHRPAVAGPPASRVPTSSAEIPASC